MNGKFDIVRLDWEERFGIASLGGTTVRKSSSLIPGIFFTAVFYGIMLLLKLFGNGNVFIEMFFPGGEAGRTFIPAITVLAAMWAFSMLLIKCNKLAVQQKALEILPGNGSRNEKLAFLEENFEETGGLAAPELLKHRLELENKGLSEVEITDLIDDAVNDWEKASDSSFIFIGTLIWSIPVLGFTGTVLGLAKAVGNFGSLVKSDGLEAVLPQITGGLATAFETTLIALVLALILQIFSSCCNQSELRFAASLKKAVLSAANKTQE